MRTSAMTTIGQRVKQRRRELGMSQDALAKRAGISKSFLSDLETGTPGTTLLQMIDVANVFADMVAGGSGDKGKKKKADEDEEEEPATASFPVLSPELKKFESLIRARAAAARAPGSLPSWRGLLGKLWRIHRLKLFDNPAAKPLDHPGMLGKGRVTVIDLSDIDSPQMNNLVIADIL